MTLSGKKAFVALALSFLAGIAFASLAWWIVYRKEQMKWAVAIAGNWHREADVATYMLTYLEAPDATNARRLTFAASNQIASFSAGVKELDAYTLPLLSISERYYGKEIKRYNEFLAERNKRLQASRGATNGNGVK
jgi:hypothetical protein